MRGGGGSFVGISSIASSNTHRWFGAYGVSRPRWITEQAINVDGGHGLCRGPDISGMLEPLYGADGLRGVVEQLWRA